MASAAALDLSVERLRESEHDVHAMVELTVPEADVTSVRQGMAVEFHTSVGDGKAVHAFGTPSVVHFGDEIGDRELQLVRPESSAATFGRETVTLAKEQQDIGRLPDEQLAGLQERWRERRTGEIVFVLQRRELRQQSGSRHLVAARPRRREP